MVKVLVFYVYNLNESKDEKSRGRELYIFKTLNKKLKVSR